MGRDGTSFLSGRNSKVPVKCPFLTFVLVTTQSMYVRRDETSFLSGRNLGDVDEVPLFYLCVGDDAIDVCAERRDLIFVRSKSGSVGPSPVVTDLSLPHPPCRVFVHLARCFLLHPPCRVFVHLARCFTGLSLPHPPPKPPSQT
jgi:hypothetical protein